MAKQKFEVVIEKFGKMGEKSGWTYFRIEQQIAQKLNKGIKTSYRVKGKLDQLEITSVSILPMGEGAFIMPLNADMRKKLRKKQGDRLLVDIEVDRSEYKIHEEFLEAMETIPEALYHFKQMPRSHQNYFSKWIESAKISQTRYDRITRAVIALSKNQNYTEMIREGKGE